MSREPIPASHAVRLLHRILDENELRLAAHGDGFRRYARSRRRIYFRILADLARRGRQIQRRRVATGTLDISEMIRFEFTTWWRLSALAVLGFGVLYLRASPVGPMACDIATRFCGMLRNSVKPVQIIAE
jgi:hypothetical protein